MARFSQLAVAAAQMAVADADLPITPENADRVGVLLSNSIGSVAVTERNYSVLKERGWKRINPLFMAIVLPNMVSSNVSIVLGARGYNSTVATACAGRHHRHRRGDRGDPSRRRRRDGGRRRRRADLRDDAGRHEHDRRALDRNDEPTKASPPVRQGPRRLRGRRGRRRPDPRRAGARAAARRPPDRRDQGVRRHGRRLPPHRPRTRAARRRPARWAWRSKTPASAPRRSTTSTPTPPRRRSATAWRRSRSAAPSASTPSRSRSANKSMTGHMFAASGPSRPSSRS